MIQQNLLQMIQAEKVEWKTLGDITNYEQPTRYLVTNTQYNEAFDTPVLTAGKTFILGYTNETEGIYQASINPVIIFDDFTTANKWVNFNFKVKSSAMKIITSKDEEKYLLRYIYFWLNTLPGEKTDNDHKRQWISNYAEKKIPIPSLEIQQKIVKILDKMTELEATLEATLEAELSQRRRQYEYYRNALLDFDNRGGVIAKLYPDCLKDVVWKTLGEVAENLNFMRRPITSGLREAGNIPYYGASGIVDYVKDYIFDGDFLLISEDGANLLARKTPIAFSISGKSWVNNHAHILKFATYAERRFIEFYLNNIDLTPYISGSAQPKLNKQSLNSIKVPNPPLEIQQKIVAILDQFDTLTQSISQGLPREITLRRRQYEYYRGQLFNFAPAA